MPFTWKKSFDLILYQNYKTSGIAEGRVFPPFHFFLKKDIRNPLRKWIWKKIQDTFVTVGQKADPEFYIILNEIWMMMMLNHKIHVRYFIF